MYLSNSSTDLAGNTNMVVSLTYCSYRCTLQNFEKLFRTDNFLHLPYFWVKTFISSNDLVVSSEKIVFEAVMKWIKFLPPTRMDKLHDLLYEIRMVYLPTDYLTDRVANEELILNSEPCKELVQKVRNYYLFPKIREVFSNMQTIPRKFSSHKNGIYAICGGSYETGTNVYYCDILNNTWHKMKYTTPYCNIKCAITVNQKIMMFLNSEIQTFHVKTGEWKIVVQPVENFNYSSVELHGKVIYCFYDDGKIYCLHTEQYRWYRSGRMPTRKWLSRAVSLGDFIYVTGGLTAVNSLNDVEKYNPLTERWTEVNPMLTPRFRHGCTSWNGKIFIAGGYTKISIDSLKTVEVYDSVTNHWVFVSSVRTPCRRNFALVACNDEIYAINDNNFEIYDPENEEWRCGFPVPERIQWVVTVPTDYQCERFLHENWL